MRIVILIAKFPPVYLGGSEIAAYHLAEQLGKLGHDVHVITTLDREPGNYTRNKCFEVHRLKTVELPVLRNVLYSIQALYKVRRIKPDLVHSQSTSFFNAGLAAYLIKMVLNIPIAIWGQGDEYLVHFEKPFRKHLIKSADLVIALTKDMKNVMLKFYNKPMHILPNGYDANVFKNLYKDTLRKDLLFKDDEIIIIFVGRLVKIKGINYLIESMKYVHGVYPKSRLIIIGEGGERANLERLVKSSRLTDCVTFMGKISNENVPRHLVAADIFVLPSLSEGLPVVLLEAMAAGLPIIATDVRGIKEIIVDTRNGFLVEPKSPQAIAEKLSLLIESDGLSTRISEFNLYDVKKYSWESIVLSLVKMYEGILKS